MHQRTTASTRHTTREALLIIANSRVREAAVMAILRRRGCEFGAHAFISSPRLHGQSAEGVNEDRVRDLARDAA